MFSIYEAVNVQRVCVAKVVKVDFHWVVVGCAKPDRKPVNIKSGARRIVGKGEECEKRAGVRCMGRVSLV